MTGTEFGALLPTVFGLLWVKDTFLTSLFGKGNGGAPCAIFILALGLILNGCVTYNRCYEKFGSKTDIIRIPITIRDTVKIPVKADSNKLTIYINNIKKLVRDSVYTQSDSISKIKIQYWIDKFNNLNFKAYTPPDTLLKIVTIHDTIPCPPQTVFTDKPTTKTQVFWQKYKTVAEWAFPVALLIALFLFGFIIRKSFK